MTERRYVQGDEPAGSVVTDRLSGEPRVLLAGDTHGNLPHVLSLISLAKRKGCARIVQVGDFGYWPHMSPFDEQVDQLATAAGIEFYWLDGNHENFDALEAAVDMEADSPQRMGEALWYLPRGSTWTWEGCRFMALGGAYSVDQAHRTLGRSWWPQETLTQAQVGRAMSRGPVDVMLTHDAPERAWPTLNLRPLGDKRDAISRNNRQAVDEVVSVARPRLLVHGHYHYRYTARVDDIKVEGLDCDGSGHASWIVIEPATWAQQSLHITTEAGSDATCT